jgi:hypothetical protein
VSREELSIDSSAPEQGLVASSFEPDKQQSGYIKYWKILDNLRNCELHGNTG